MVSEVELGVGRTSTVVHAIGEEKMALSAHTWQQTWKTGLVIFIGAVIWAMWPWADCTWGLTQERLPRPTDTSKAASALCLEQYSPLDEPAAVGIGVLALVLGLFARSRVPEQKLRVPRRATDTTVGAGPAAGPATAWSAPDRHGADVPDAIDLSQELDLGFERSAADVEDEGDTLMNYLEEQRELSEASEAGVGGEAATTVDGFYAPPGLGDSAILYVDPAQAAASDAATDAAGRVGNPERAYQTIAAAHAHAAKLVRQTGQPVQVRLAPGVYQEAVEVPDRVALVNHRLPAEGSVRQRLEWVSSQKEVDHPDRVTLLPPPDAQRALTLAQGRMQGVFGCHIVGREGVAQTGVVVESALAAAIVHCVIDGFEGGGIRARQSGTAAPGSGLSLVGCRVRGNIARRGGGLFATRCTLRIEQSVFERNRASVGAGALVDEAAAPAVFEQVEFRQNMATRAPDDPHEPHPVRARIDSWSSRTGLGGGLAVRRSEARIVGCRFLVNAAETAGGGLANLGSRILIKGERRSDEAFSENKSAAGGAAACIGWTGCQAILKLTAVTLGRNLADSFGGGIFAVGLGVVQMADAQLIDNHSKLDRGMGGAIFAVKGARLLAKGCRFSKNKSAGHAGALGAVNASIELGDGCIIEENTAQGGMGGAIIVLSRADAELEELMSTHRDFTLPFALRMLDVSVRHNAARRPPAGIWVGNRDDQPTFPVEVALKYPERVRHNEAWDEGGGLDEQIVVQWAGRVVATADELFETRKPRLLK